MNTTYHIGIAELYAIRDAATVHELYRRVWSVMLDSGALQSPPPSLVACIEWLLCQDHDAGLIRVGQYAKSALKRLTRE